MLRVVQDEAERAEFVEVLDEIVRDGARRMLAAALESEVEAYVTAAKAERDGKGHALVTRNGKARERTVVTGAGALEVRAPRVDDRRTDEQGERIRFASDILPPYARRSPKVSQVLPLLYPQRTPPLPPLFRTLHYGVAHRGRQRPRIGGVVGPLPEKLAIHRSPSVQM